MIIQLRLVSLGVLTSFDFAASSNIHTIIGKRKCPTVPRSNPAASPVRTAPGLPKSRRI